MEYNLYKDIQNRTDGNVYLGIVGPVRTGKSTFIKRFMDILVLPYMENEHEKTRAVDELPQSGVGKTITTTEPKFVPKESAEITLMEDTRVKIRLVDCVGFMIPGAAGILEGETERLVKTPWSEEEIPFSKAAEIGTQKVIRDHSTIGVALFTDGSFGDFSRKDYLEAEERTIRELREIHKPFIIVLNSARPYSEDTRKLVESLSQQYQVATVAVNCEQMKEQDILAILQEALYEFPVTRMEFYMPRWVELLPAEHDMKKSLAEQARALLDKINTMRDFRQLDTYMECPYLEHVTVEEISLSDGAIKILLQVKEEYYYQMLSELLQQPVETETKLMTILQEFSKMKQEYVKVQMALEAVKQKGYGVVSPQREEIVLEEPELIKHGNKYGVKIKASSPSIHMIRANIETEIAPIVGTEQQATDLVEYIKQQDQSEDGIWNTTIFGKTVEQLVQDGIQSKIITMNDDCQMQLQESMQKIVNDSNGKMVCILI